MRERSSGCAFRCLLFLLYLSRLLIPLLSGVPYPSGSRLPVARDVRKGPPAQLATPKDLYAILTKSLLARPSDPIRSLSTQVVRHATGRCCPPRAKCRFSSSRRQAGQERSYRRRHHRCRRRSVSDLSRRLHTGRHRHLLLFPKLQVNDCLELATHLDASSGSRPCLVPSGTRGPPYRPWSHTQAAACRVVRRCVYSPPPSRRSPSQVPRALVQACPPVSATS